jgi:hypothetical protein
MLATVPARSAGRSICWKIGWNNYSFHWHITLKQMRARAMDGYRVVAGECCTDCDELEANEYRWHGRNWAKGVEEWFEGYFKAALVRNPALTREQLENMTITEMLLAEPKQGDDGGAETDDDERAGA